MINRRSDISFVRPNGSMNHLIYYSMLETKGSNRWFTARVDFILTTVAFSSPGHIWKVQRHFCFPLGWWCYRHQWVEAYNAQDNLSQQRSILPKISVLLRLRSPGCTVRKSQCLTCSKSPEMMWFGGGLIQGLSGPLPSPLPLYHSRALAVSLLVPLRSQDAAAASSITSTSSYTI